MSILIELILDIGYGGHLSYEEMHFLLYNTSGIRRIMILEHLSARDITDLRVAE